MKPTLVVLAAGMGSRFGGVKQVEPVGPRGEIILEYSVFDAIRAGFGKVVFVLREDIVADFSSHVLPRFASRIATDIVLQSLDRLPAPWKVPVGRTKPWGTGHAVWMARDAVAEPFAVINADDFYGADAYGVMARHLETCAMDSGDFSMVGYRLDRTVSEFGTVSRGLCTTDAGGFLADVVEHTRIGQTPDGIVSTLIDGTRLPLRGDEVVSMNLFGFTPLVFKGIGEQMEAFMEGRGQKDPGAELYIPAVVSTMVHGGQARVRMLHSRDSWFGITYKEDLGSTKASIQALVAAGQYPEDLWKS